ncbi:hypothetical protein LTR91_002212 [Friedmanniomyces endolithicus]|uniref:Transglutaminase-like domain-containing protein n=1 Tax=Friedmanniomyces endolithicus TaxID=329885 RepID=A0AAN6J614_9PEZI|nr:hypothetical protein LTR35_015947 [Friedmanniomyces endolithicus]KAK0273566.1 hypothetical protein LTS00_015767 [Friedmanniomyces endolithicus]KAK0318204.1 hypothetical protein LTR82_010903 [Friedmanniomyces endolithicus]KAK0909131.1 hypothetical protein LTR57_016490 [Friedmanniomyces endolithicus]KAK1001156.1 hypothetical protein LTR54_008668 [Friedmanniomyces endolithicus]
MADDLGSMSVKERIAALKLSSSNGQVPLQPPPSYDQTTNGVVRRARPPPPPRPALPQRPQSTNVPPAQDHVALFGNTISNEPEQDRSYANSNGMDGISRPALPPRTSTQSSQTPALPPRRPTEPSPALPPRRPSETPSQPDYRLSRRTSNESVSSVATARSSMSGMSTATSQSDRYSVRAPSYDPAALPPLPPKRTEEQKQAYYDSGSSSGRRPQKPTYSSPSIAGRHNGTTPPPSRRPSAQPPPALPSRAASGQHQPLQIEAAPRPPAAEPPRPKRSALGLGLSQPTDARPPVMPARPGSVPQTNGTPPPVPKDSRPDLAGLQASKPRLNDASSASSIAPSNSCLICRDFTAVDAHAARFPRQSLPRQDLTWLAQQLTAPFPSATDKARAIFTWHHHNIAYDTKAFFSGNLRPSTPQSTLETGLAVCEGYAGLFAALALKAGLEAYVVSGHGKGFGYSKLKSGDPLPVYKAGHAWNAVKIDGGQWKLLDACWGAGHLDGNTNGYKQAFAPQRFTQSNDEFGLDHFPGESTRQYRSDGRVVTWEEYILGNKKGCGAHFFSGWTTGEGISETSFQPAQNPIVLAQQGPTVRFSFQKVCPHWDPLRNGKGPYVLYTLGMDGLEGTERNHVPFETNGEVWWCDVDVRDLGRAGQSVSVMAVTDWRGKEGRGLSIREYREWKGKVAMAWGFVAKWDLA